ARAGAGGATQKVNINTADATALDTLPGVGPSTAAKIIAERESKGPFATVDDLGRVSGIGPKRLDALRDLISAGP
ncbi:MAG TPA: ComEA family DNA-binding protein, partial [Coriobacteriia bacterium]|nr:ComEA family DNA-binding protein [Coriobacteriia bacterium]